jgi:hypothetical protein
MLFDWPFFEVELCFVFANGFRIGENWWDFFSDNLIACCRWFVIGAVGSLLIFTLLHNCGFWLEFMLQYVDFETDFWDSSTKSSNSPCLYLKLQLQLFPQLYFRILQSRTWTWTLEFKKHQDFIIYNVGAIVGLDRPYSTNSRFLWDLNGPRSKTETAGSWKNTAQVKNKWNFITSNAKNRFYT